MSSLFVSIKKTLSRIFIFKLTVLASHKVQTNYNYKTGLFLAIHNQSRTPFFPITKNYGIHVNTGYETYIALRRKITKKMEYPYSNCIKDLTPFSPESEKIFKFFKHLNIDYYDQEICASLCFQDKLIDSCGCSEIGIQAIRNTSYCTTMPQLGCLFSFLSNFYVSDNFVCQNTCQKECYKVEYDIQTNVVKYPNLNYLNYLRSENDTSSRFPNDEKNAEKFADNAFIKLMVNYETIEYVYVEENPKINLEILLGSIGG